MNIVKVMAGFPYGLFFIWQVWDGREFLGAFKTRADAGKFSEQRMVEIETKVSEAFFKRLEEEKA